MTQPYKPLTNPANIPANIGHINNKAVMRHKYKWPYTQEELDEYNKCKNSADYFVENYCKVIHLDRGLVPFKLYPYQRKMFDLYNNNRFSVVLSCRQSGKTVGVAGYLLWYALFHKDQYIAIVANQGGQAREIMSRIQLMLEYVPYFLQPGCKTYNKGSMVFSNNTTIATFASGSNSLRGKSCSVIYIDEAAFIERDQEFFTSTYPVISSGKKSKVILTSTLNGLTDEYYRILQGAINGTNDFKHMRVDWWDVPGRDEVWKHQTISNTSQKQFDREFGNEIQSVGTTLINPNVLVSMKAENPIRTAEGAKIYKEPAENHNYVLVVDVCKGRGIDYSTFSVLDVTNVPFEQVATFRDNTISPIIYPDVILKWAQAYNKAYVVIESNDHGGMVHKILYYDYEYENMYTGQVKNGHSLGMEVSNKVKRIGCSNLKDLIEKAKLKIVDKDTIEELTYFEHDGRNYSAKKGHHDDTVSPLVCFGFFTQTTTFEYVSKDNMSLLMQEERERLINESVPFSGNLGQTNESEDVIFEKPVLGAEGFTERFVKDDTFGIAVERTWDGNNWRF